MKKYHGINGLLEFCTLLQSKNIHFNMNMYSADSITVTLTLVGARVEVSFQQNGTNYSVFEGSEATSSDLSMVLKMIAEEN